nr:hypothetical protein [Variovorax paradoxus]
MASNQGLTLNTGSLQNTQGNIQSAQAGVQLAVTNQLVNGSGGSINAATDLNVQAGSLANSGSLRGANDVNVAVGGALTNDGSITAGRNTTIQAGSLQSSNTGVLGAGIQNDGSLGSAGDLRVTSNGALIANGTNLAAGNATLLGASVDLSASQTSAANIAVTARQGNVTTNKATITTPGILSVKAAGAVSNVEGTLAGNGNTTVDAASLDNSAGTLASVAGDLRVTTSGATVNTAGRMLASGPVVLANSGLANTDGAVSGDSLSIDTHGGSLDNTRGTITATTTVAVSSGVLANDAGLIQSGSAMTINTNGQALTNTNAAGHSTRQGGIASADTLVLNTGAVNNAAGFIGATNAVDATTQSFTNTNGGMVLGQSTVAINTQGASYHNSHGQTLAIGDLGVNAGSIANIGGLIRSTATTTLNAGSIDNRLTSGAEQGIEGQNVSIAATTVDNTSGAIRADVNTTLTSGGRVDNGTGGLIFAGNTLAIVDPTAAAKTLNLVNGGTLLAGKALLVDAASLANNGKLLSQQDMRLALTQDVVIAAGSETIANRDLSIAAGGNISNSGRIAAGNDLSLSAPNIDNTATGDIQGTITRLSATGTVTNRGVIDGSLTRIDAGTLDNIGTGRIYGDQISIGVGTLNNLAETAVNGTTSAATIAARRRLDIGATTINNRDGSLIFSDGDLAIGGSLDALGHATGSAGAVNNHAATIEATRNVDIKTATLSNTNGGVTWTLEPGSDQHIVEYALPGSSVRYAASEVLFSIGGFQRIPDIGWNGWAGVPATDPQGPGSNTRTASGHFTVCLQQPQS